MAEEIKNQDNNNLEAHSDDSHEYDGIKELNNPAPFWIMLLLIATIGFSLFYLITYFGYPNNGMDQENEYKAESANFNKEKEAQRKAKVTASKGMTESEIIEAGTKIFNEKGCIACHGMHGEGNNIGPNLTDHYWINGCSEDDIKKIITEGKVEKGMTSFKSVLTEDQISHMATFISKSLVGSNPQNAKAPQGNECK